MEGDFKLLMRNIITFFFLKIGTETFSKRKVTRPVNEPDIHPIAMCITRL